MYASSLQLSSPMTAMAEDNKMIREEEEEEEVAIMSMENLPTDVRDNILSWLPVKTLLTLRHVCKSWRALISNQDFVKMHLNRSLATNSNLSLILRSSSKFYTVDLDACEQHRRRTTAVELHYPLKPAVYAIQTWGSCNGLLCVYEFPKGDIFFWNPFTGGRQKLPFIPIEFPINLRGRHLNAYGFGYDHTTKDYKLVRVGQFYIKNDNSLHSEVNVYSLSTNAWRRIGDMPFLPIDCERPVGVLVNSVLHWVVDSLVGHSTARSIVISFDLKDEKYREVPLPDRNDEDSSFDMGVLGEQLCIFSRDCWRNHSVWVMKEYGAKDSWTKQFSIEKSVECFEPLVGPLCYLKDDEIVLFQQNSMALVIYDPLKGRSRNVKIHDVPGAVFQTAICVGSLVPLNSIYHNNASMRN